MSDPTSVSVYGTPFIRGMNGRNRKLNGVEARRATIERMYMRILSEMCMNRFKWEGLPDSIDPRFLELTLFQRALSVFYYEKDFNKHLALQATMGGRLDYQNNPIAFTLYGNGYISKSISADDCVPIWANYERIPDLDIVYTYATKLSDVDLSIEINAKQARRTKILAATENQKLSIMNIARQIDEGASVVTINKSGLSFDDIRQSIMAIDLDVEPMSIVNLHILRTRLWGECMGLLGINNANQDKKERLVANEVDANNEQVSAMRAVNLNARQEAARRINEKFDMNISVDYSVQGETPGAVGIPDELQNAQPKEV